jgi:YHS domain-containing protein
MSDESLSTSSVIKMKLLTWFSGYTVVSRTQTPISGRFGSSKYVTEWCLAKPAATEPQPHAAETSVTDPVCGTTVDAETARWRFTHEDREYLFCGEDCLEKFSTDPEGTLSGEKGQAQVEAAVEDGTEHICPVNPKVQQAGPGSCPKCGAPLEAKEADSEPPQDPG